MLEAPLPHIVPPPRGDGRCPGCAAALAPDQRYCLNCGEPVAPLANWAAEAMDAEPQMEAAAASVSTSRLPAPRSTALMTLLVLALGVFIGGAFGPRST